MKSPNTSIYREAPALMTDLYQLTMAHGYWKKGLHQKKAVFNLFFRNIPFKGGYAVAGGLEQALAYLQDFRFSDSDLCYLSDFRGNDERPIFEPAFLDFLSKERFSCDVAAIPEGTVVFANEPLLRVSGSVLQAQLVETALLNIINFQTLVATKAARICDAAQGEPVMEFGFRRAQGLDGAVSASRAAYIGGCIGTSNVYAGKIYNIPVLGTHAHSWVQAYNDELQAFREFADSMPNNTVFLVDTYHTPQGIDNAITVAQEMLKKGYKMTGLRLDSGDLAYLSRLARQKLESADLGFMKIVASNDLDEHLIASLKQQQAAIDTWGIGTKLVTAYDQPALGGVYKLAAMENDKGDFEDRIKLSEQSIKINIPGIQQVRRFYKNDKLACDMIFDERDRLPELPLLIDPVDPTRRKSVANCNSRYEDLLQPVLQKGQLVYDLPELNSIRQRRAQQLEQLDAGIRRLTNPHLYPVGLEAQLYNKRMDLILNYREKFQVQ